MPIGGKPSHGLLQEIIAPDGHVYGWRKTLQRLGGGSRSRAKDYQVRLHGIDGFEIRFEEGADNGGPAFDLAKIINVETVDDSGRHHTDRIKGIDCGNVESNGFGWLERHGRRSGCGIDGYIRGLCCHGG